VIDSDVSEENALSIFLILLSGDSTFLQKLVSVEETPERHNEQGLICNTYIVSFTQKNSYC